MPFGKTIVAQIQVAPLGKVRWDHPLISDYSLKLAVAEADRPGGNRLTYFRRLLDVWRFSATRANPGLHQGLLYMTIHTKHLHVWHLLKGNYTA